MVATVTGNAAQPDQQSLDRLARRALDTSLRNIDRVMMAIQSYGTSEPSLTVDDLVGRTRLQGQQIYSALHNLQDRGNIQIITTPITGAGGPRKITGVKLVKLPTPETISNNAALRSAPLIIEEIKKRLDATIPLTKGYMQRKLAIARAREILNDANVEFSIAAPDEPYAEESIALLKEVESLTEQLAEALGQMYALRRQNQILQVAAPDSPEYQDAAAEKEASNAEPM
jgi:hypothetical protein